MLVGLGTKWGQPYIGIIIPCLLGKQRIFETASSIIEYTYVRWLNASVCWSNTHHVMVISKIIKVTSSFLQMNNPYHVPLCSTIPLPFLLFNFPCSMVLSCAHLNYSHILLLLSGSLSSFPRFPVLQLDKEFLLFQHVSAGFTAMAGGNRHLRRLRDCRNCRSCRESCRDCRASRGPRAAKRGILCSGGRTWAPHDETLPRDQVACAGDKEHFKRIQKC